MTTPFKDALVADGPVSLWLYDETTGTSAADSGSAGNTGTYTGGFTLGRSCTVNPDTGNNAVQLNGSTGKITSGATSIPVGGNARTLVALVRRGSLEGTLISCNTASGQKFILSNGFLSGGNRYLFTDGVNGGNNITIAGAEVPSTVGYHLIHFVLTDSTHWSYYLDGSFVKSGVFPVAINTAALTSVWVGDRADASQPLGATVDMAAIYNSALTGSQIAAHFAQLVAPIPQALLSQQPIEVALFPDLEKARLSQQPIEVSIIPDTEKARLSQQPIEVSMIPDTEKARTSQYVIEVSYPSFLPFHGMVSQLPLEVAMVPDNEKARLSQEPIEVAMVPDNEMARMSQFVIEVAIAQHVAHGRNYAQVIG